MPFDLSVSSVFGEALPALVEKAGEVGDLKVRTLEGYRSAIVGTLKAKAVNVGTDSYICGLVNSFYSDRPVEMNLVPSWDLTIVLNAYFQNGFPSLLASGAR